jgi:tetratricopeptide (TPR) repeat protein
MKVASHHHFIQTWAALGAGVWLALAAGALEVGAQNFDHTLREAMSDAGRGSRLSVEQVAALEVRVKANPEDLGSRNQLLGYYSLARFKSQESREARQQHLLWLFANQPEAGILGTGYSGFDRTIDGSAYEQGKELWLKQVKANPNVPKILDHAAKYFMLGDKPIAEGLLKQGQALEPKNPDWARQLAHFYSREVKHHKTDPIGTAKKALEQMEQAQSLTTLESSRVSNLSSLAKMAFDAGEVEKARTYATQVMSLAAAKGDGVFNGNLILGRLAVREGKLDVAGQHLLASGKTEGSILLNSSGPNFSLAKDLLEKGHKDTVLEFFKLCGNFWKNGGPKLDRWSKEVAAGLTPDFGINLAY